jgi:predicted transcriptional regulator
MKHNKRALLIVEPTSKAFERFADVLKHPSKSSYKDCTVLSFPSYDILGKVITGARLEILSAIRTFKPKSIQELARNVKRDFKNVYNDVKLLARYGLIELKESGARKTALPVSKFTEFLIAA